MLYQLYATVTLEWTRRIHCQLSHLQLDGKYSERVQIPAKAFLSPTLGNTCHTYYFAARYIQFRISWRSYSVNNRRFTEFFDRYFHIPLPIVTKHELGCPFPPRNLRIKFGANPSTIFLVIVVTDRHTDTHTHTQTNANENIFPRFCADNHAKFRCLPDSYFDVLNISWHWESQEFSQIVT